MGQFLAFSKKELRESAATYRLYILLAVFAFLGILSPLTAKLTPELLKALSSSSQMAGMEIKLAEPSYMDAWVQFFKNVGQLGLIVMVIIFSGLMAGELSRGTLINLITKGLGRPQIIGAKFVSASLIWALAYALCLGLCYGYSAYFWPVPTLNSPLMAFAAPWLFGELLLALIIFGGTAFASVYGSLFTCLVAVVVFALIGIAPGAFAYNPINLAGGSLSLLTGALERADFAPAMIISAGLTALLLALSIFVFKRKSL